MEAGLSVSRESYGKKEHMPYYPAVSQRPVKTHALSSFDIVNVSSC